MDIPKHVIKMIDPNGFDEVFNEHNNSFPTYEKTFKAMNEEFERWTGKKRYSNYESYRKAREKRIKA